MSRPGRLLRPVAKALAVGLALAAAAGGCGIPDETRVVVHGTGPPPRQPTDGVSANTPKLRDEATSREQFVANFLAAAAGDISTATERVRKFIAPADSADFKPQAELNVVRLTDNPLISPGSVKVDLKVQHIGVLGADGTLRPPTGNEPDRYTLDVQEATGPPNGTGGWYVAKPESVLLLSDVALAEYYQTRSIYFWNKDYTALVPDLRYLPKASPPEGQPNEILKWLTAGPSPWLQPAVLPLPPDTAAIGNVPDVSDGKLRINLTAPALPDEKDAVRRLGWQLMWSMRTNLTTALELRIANDLRETFTGQAFLASNPAYKLADRPERFCVYGGQVRRMTTSESADSPVPLLTAQQNHHVRTAALSRSGDTDYAALVSEDRDGTVWLLTGGARTGTTAALRRVRLPARPPGAPVWLRPTARGGPSGGHGLLAVGGRLLRIFTDGTGPQPVALPGATGAVSAVAVAPDGLRLALVAGGRVYVTVLVDNGSTLKAAPAREVRTALNQVTGVDWTAENSIVVAGNRLDNGRVAIVDSTVDGGMQSPRLNDLGEARVSHLTAHPANPIASTTTTDSVADALVAYVANGTAYDLSGVPERIEADEVVGVPPNAPAATLTAPFFLR